MSPAEEVAASLIFILPAYAANAAPLTLAAVVKGRHPIDFGLTLPDGRRLLGDAKTWEGLVAGVAVGVVVGHLLGDAMLGLALGLGAMLGDVAGSFLKRRLGLEPGSPTPILDQLDFLAGALSLAYLSGYQVTPLRAAILAALTPPIHVATNAIAYALGLKDRPY
ncbi:hypothetical protein B6U99_07635 [Candidatus Geothermarchaeota archaeon ex4572_27]|nr:MAG: hypothetical protein B6U99_07635 [Candidatus Geothermarchaeota archaeon ex4572_27]